MLRKWGGLGVVLAAVMVWSGCGGNSTTEIKATTDGGAKLDAEQSKTFMEQSFSKMPPEQQARMKAMMDEKMKQAGQPPAGK